MGYVYRGAGATAPLSAAEKAKRDLAAKIRRSLEREYQGLLAEKESAIKNLTASNEALAARAEKAEVELAEARLEIRKLKVEAEQTNAATVLQEQVSSLEEERDGLVATIESINLAHRAELRELRSEKRVAVEKAAAQARSIAELQDRLLTAAEDAASVAITISDEGVELHGSWATAPAGVLKHHLNTAVLNLVANASDAQLAQARTLTDGVSHAGAHH